MKKKTLSTEDWTKITSSFDIMNQKFPNAIAAEDTPTYKFTSIKGVKEQLQERSIGEVVFYMDYLSPITGEIFEKWMLMADETPKIGKCEIIEE